MIEKKNILGLIKLKQNVKPEDLLDGISPYNLTVIATDDGSCCTDESASVVHSQTAFVTIGMTSLQH